MYIINFVSRYCNIIIKLVNKIARESYISVVVICKILFKTERKTYERKCLKICLQKGETVAVSEKNSQT